MHAPAMPPSSPPHDDARIRLLAFALVRASGAEQRATCCAPRANRTNRIELQWGGVLGVEHTRQSHLASRYTRPFSPS